MDAAQGTPQRALPLRMDRSPISPQTQPEGAAFHITITVPGPPRAKGAGRVGVAGGRGMVFTDPKTRSELAMIRMMAEQAMAGRAPYEGPVILRLCAWREVPASLSKRKRALALEGRLFPVTRPDFDNHYKMVDALNKIVWRDDAQVVSVVGHKRYAETPRLVIDVRSMAT